MVARLWLAGAKFLGAVPAGGRKPLIPVNVPRESARVKSKAHNMLWISAPGHRMSHRLCSYWPKYSHEDFGEAGRSDQSCSNCSAFGAEKQGGLRREMVHRRMDERIIPFKNLCPLLDRHPERP